MVRTQPSATEATGENEIQTGSPDGSGATEENAPAEKKILLIAEDNNDLRHFIASYFSSTFSVMEAADGRVAEEMAIESLPDVIVSDLKMPEMQGDELCQRLKNDERTSHIPIIMLTAIGAEEAEMQSLKAGADDYITKPFNIEILQQKLKNQIRRQENLRKKIKFDQLTSPADVKLENPDERFMRKAMEVIEKYMGDPDFDIEQFATEVGVSRMQLYRKIAALTSMTVKEFIRNIRIKRACQLIEQGRLTISEVAYEVGFKDIAYFRKCFKAQVGKNPSEMLPKG